MSKIDVTKRKRITKAFLSRDVVKVLNKYTGYEYEILQKGNKYALAILAPNRLSSIAITRYLPPIQLRDVITGYIIGIKDGHLICEKYKHG